MSQAELSTPRLRLRPRTMADLDACVAMDLDPEVHRFIYDDGPPDPIDIAADTGFNSASRGAMRLPFRRIDSMASGMPCPRMRSEP